MSKIWGQSSGISYSDPEPSILSSVGERISTPEHVRLAMLDRLLGEQVWLELVATRAVMQCGSA